MKDNLLVIDDGHPTHPRWCHGQALVVTVTREKEVRSWWMRLLRVYPSSSVVIDVREEGSDLFLARGTLAHGGETSFIVRSVDK